MTTITEAEVEQATLNWLAGLGWQVAYGPDIASETPDAEQGDCMLPKLTSERSAFGVKKFRGAGAS